MSPGDSTVLFRALPSRFSFAVDDKRLLKAFARTLSREVADGKPFTCLITSDHQLHRLNKKFLKHDYPTDVLSFPSACNNGDLGEIAISAERAESQASQFGHNRIDELKILMLHGLLHLCGMDHETDRGEMARAERTWRVAFDLPITLITRASARTANERLAR